MTNTYGLPIDWNNLICTVSSACGKYLCEPNWSWRPNPFLDYDLWYAISGQGDMIVNGVSYPIQPGSCFVFRPGDRVIGNQNPKHPLIVFFCHFTIQDCKGNVCTEGVLPDQRQASFSEHPTVEPLLRQLIDLASVQRAEDTNEMDLLLKLILIRWIKEMARSMSRQTLYHKKIILQVQDVLRFQLSESIEYRKISETVGYSPRYISKLMKQYTGLTLKEMITKLRMERAVHLVTETTMSITEVSFALGYHDIYTFSKLFKRYYGFSPSVLRKRDQAVEAYT
jgi:AraC-like DNA-binding protein